jgi:hypothetical protein
LVFSLDDGLFVLERPLNDDEWREIWGARLLEVTGGHGSLSQTTIYARVALAT